MGTESASTEPGAYEAKESAGAAGCPSAAHADLLAHLLNDPSEKYERRISRAKQKEYPRRSAEDWTREQDKYRGLAERLKANIPDTVPRVDGGALANHDFISRFEAPNTPVVVTGLQGEWPAQERWSLSALLREYGGERFKVGEDDDGYAVYVKLCYYLRYLLTTTDDSPLYVFDSSFAEREGTRTLRHDYRLPKFFTDDLFKLVGEKRRPPYRWLVLGPARSGSYIHIDPLGTSAWNALLQGHKCWALFPPSVPKVVVQPGEGGGVGKQPGGREAIAWFANVYPKLASDETPPEHRPLTIVQRPGETIFVPGGWWHVVLNLDVTVAVTQNFCSRTNFDSVWRHTRKSRPKMAKKLREKLRQHEPALFERTLHLESAPDLGNASSSSSSSSSSSTSSEDETKEGERPTRPSEQPRKEKRQRSRSRSNSRSRAQKMEKGGNAMERLEKASETQKCRDDQASWRDKARRRAEGGELTA